MVPKEAKNGKHIGSSFKGVMLYVMHDKREAGENERLSSDRVAWFETRNLATDNPDTAWRLMMATAQDRERRRIEHGVSNAGNQSDKVAYHFTLSWDESEAPTLTKADMLSAVDGALKANDLQDLQAAIVAHRDTAHPHVHVIVNRTMEDGRLHKLSQSRLKLSEWALQYDLSRDQAHKLCPKRLENWEHRVKGEYTRAATDRPWHVQQHNMAAREAQNDNLTFESWKKAEAAKDLDLRKRGEIQAGRHRSAWDSYREQNKAGRNNIYQQAKDNIARSIEKNKAAFRPAYSDLGKRHWKERRAFEAREKRLSGKIENVIHAITSTPVGRQTASDRGWLAAGFRYLTSSADRAAAITDKHAREFGSVRSSHKAANDKAIAQIREHRDALLVKHKAVMAEKRQQLKDVHDQERNALRGAWRDRNTERQSSYVDFKARAADLKARRAAAGQVRDTFKKKAPEWRQDGRETRSGMKPLHKRPTPQKTAEKASMAEKSASMADKKTGRASDFEKVKDTKSAEATNARGRSKIRKARNRGGGRSRTRSRSPK